MTLVALLNLRSRLRIFSISRALGISKGCIVGNLLISTLMLGLPAVLVGGGIAWVVGMNQAASTLGPLVYIVDGFDVVTELDAMWFVILTGIIAGYMMLATLVGAMFILGRPVLELLQGNIMPKSKGRKNNGMSIDSNTTGATLVDISKMRFSLPEGGLIKTSKTARENSWLLIRRHIIRTPAKSILGVAVALFFILALGWLQEAVVRARVEIDRLYDTTVVYADIRPEVAVGGVIERGAIHHLSPGHIVGGYITSWTVRNISELSFVGDLYTETGHTRSFIIAGDSNDGVPDDWADIIGFNYGISTVHPANIAVLDLIYAFNDFDTMMTEHTRGFDDRFEGDLAIQFADGFTVESFTTRDDLYDVDFSDIVIPVIVYEGLLEKRGISMGETAVVVFTRGTSFITSPDSIRVQVIGTHNANIHRENLEESIMIPLGYKEHILGQMGAYIMTRFEIDTAYNREIVAIREQLEQMVIGTLARPGGFIPLSLMLLDEEMRNVVIALEQTLLLLELLYPVAVAFAVSIGAGLSMLLVMQAIKNAAVMRVLGATKKRTRVVLCTEQITVVLLGAVAGFLLLVIAGWGFGIVALIGLIMFYLLGAIIGAVAGAVLVTNKAPLDLLQVRE